MVGLDSTSSPDGSSTIVQFMSPEGEATGPPMDLPLSSTPKQLEAVLNGILEAEEPLPYSFVLANSRTEIVETLLAAMGAASVSGERLVSITYQPQTAFRVRSVTRCTASLPGHAEAVLCSAFAPDSATIATGGGDTTVRLWRNEMPHRTLTGHNNWVLAVAFSPDAAKLASAGMDTIVRIWNIDHGAQIAMLKGHRKWVTCLAWSPFHLDTSCNRLVSGSKDNTLRLWNTTTGKCIKTLAGHTAAVTCVRWSGEGSIYSASQDRTIKVWDPSTGLPIRTIGEHGHWVNTMTLSTDAVLRAGAFPLFDEDVATVDGKLSLENARERYERVKKLTGRSVERMVSGSDDFTLILWEDIGRAGNDKVLPKTRMTGHQQLVNDVCYSPNGMHVASASFDKSVRLWDGATGKFIATFRGHVGPVYRVVWSADSRLFLSASRDSTCKVWQVRTKKLKTDLPGHSDEVYAIDWSPDGKRVVSGGKDRVVKIWQH